MRLEIKHSPSANQSPIETSAVSSAGIATQGQPKHSPFAQISTVEMNGVKAASAPLRGAKRN